ncbi:MAG TPA: flagellar biosynthesis protein FlhA, partial [Pyrinomonadaceae bacterium]|nr:flagellar biosynthesis protein FlhA [Pyrinomonadaceae bacterium]
MEKILERFRALWGELRRGNVSGLLARYGDLLLPVGLMLAIGTLFVPLPPAVISALIVINLAVSVVVLSTSLYITTPTQLTSYPTILLLTTVFRLTLSVSATRAILTEGTAGGVIEALGKITAQGSIIVGAVMFVTILVVQFIVVAKGSERVAEVAARFTLDAMPGKQMAIDADMRSGLITQEQARVARGALQKESQLYGAMDGAMKFVKGDAIATIVIAMVNIAGGLATGVLTHGLTFAQAGHKYTIMTIGDGLAAIISSMLITVSAGIVVTRVSTDEETSNVGSDISRQLLRNPRPIMIGAGLLIFMGILPGMPTVP